MEMQALIEELAALVEKIKSGEASLGELEAFAAAAAQLNERAIVLRYKAYEAQVYGTPVEAPAVEQSVEETELPTMEETTEPPVELVEVVETNEESSFDLFSMDEEEDTPAFELSMEETPVFEAEEHTPVDLDPAPELHLEKLEVSHEEPIAEVKEDIQDEVSTPFQDGNLHGIYTKLSTNDGSLASRLMTVRLETLKGAFGFNERLQIIQELFNGSNDEFSSLIDRIESTTSKDQARQLVSSYASKFNWDEESPLALELIQKVERKYA